ncbi:hypothetical protein BD626DRAFT_568860 [Schizophyllum amplum]|uniref:HNH nuclease domain-containing protein n=1 Tax=Schizophyllum amplum TaxID=97359 RepID=A0A550CF88_9AGAR|nr:hypothetical protein BD626DRAFT_568860 [Auriculariopsis ampla]
MAKTRASCAAEEAERDRYATVDRRGKTVIPEVSLRRSARAQARLSKPIVKPITKPSSQKKPSNGARRRLLTPSSVSSDELAETLAQRDADYVLSDPVEPEIEDQADSGGPTEWVTPQKNIDARSARPPVEPLILISVLGRRCVVTLISNDLHSVQDAHILAHASDLRVTIAFQTFMVIERLNLGSRFNRVFLDSRMHIAYDHGQLALIPVFADLQRLLRALQKKKLPPAPGQDEEPARNAAGFTPHEQVFPRDDEREFHIVPLSNWGDVPIMRKVDVDGDEYRLYRPPWTNPDGTPSLPMAKLHCSPYFVTYKAYLALKQPGVRAPLYPREVDLVIMNGQLMERYMK